MFCVTFVLHRVLTPKLAQTTFSQKSGSNLPPKLCNTYTCTNYLRYIQTIYSAKSFALRSIHLVSVSHQRKSLHVDSAITAIGPSARYGTRLKTETARHDLRPGLDCFLLGYPHSLNARGLPPPQSALLCFVLAHPPFSLALALECKFTPIPLTRTCRLVLLGLR